MVLETPPKAAPPKAALPKATPPKATVKAKAKGKGGSKGKGGCTMTPTKKGVEKRAEDAVVRFTSAMHQAWRSGLVSLISPVCTSHAEADAGYDLAQARSVLDKISKIPAWEWAKGNKFEAKLTRLASETDLAFTDDELLGPRVNGDIDKFDIDTDVMQIHTVNTKIDGLIVHIDVL